MTYERSVRWARWGVVMAALGLGACYETFGAYGEKAGDATSAGVKSAFKSHAQIIPCSLASSSQLVDRDVVSRRAYDGPIRPREEVAVVLTRGVWSASVFMTKLDVNAIDGLPEAHEQDPRSSTETTGHLPIEKYECGGDECFRLAVLPGNHIVTLSAVSEEGDKRRSRIGGRVEFTAEAGGLYSFQVCRPTTKDGPVFWARDESGLACVSSVCPSP